jgi:hypothetical protein
MLFGNNYENSLRGAGNAAQATTQMAPEERAAGLLRAMRQAHGVAAKMRYFGEPGASGAVVAADALEITWRTARDMPDHPKLADMTMSAARNCRAMAGYLPSRVNDQARQQASERASTVTRAIKQMAPQKVRAEMRAEAQAAQPGPSR